MPVPSAGQITRTAATDHITTHLRTAIITGNLAPGEKVTIGAVAAATGFSPTPVGMALQALTKAGLLTGGYNTTLTVATVTPNEAADAVEALQMLAAAARTTPNGADQFLTALRHVRAGNPNAFRTAHRHAMELADLCQNQVFADLIRDGLDGMLYRAQFTTTTGKDTNR